MPQFIYISGAASPLLTDGYSPVAAYSVRKVRTAYTGPCMRIRRSSDNAEQDIGFFLGALDTTAILTFIGSGTAYVVTWYDQSGNARDTTNAVASYQPTIAESGAINYSGTKPALNFYKASKNYMRANCIVDLRTATAHSVLNLNSTGGVMTAVSFNTSTRWYMPISLTGTLYFGYNSSTSAVSIGPSDTSRRIFTMVSNLTKMEGFVNGVSKGSVTPSVSINSSIIDIGGYGASNNADASIQEVVWIQEDVGASRAAYETNINNYFGVY